MTSAKAARLNKLRKKKGPYKGKRGEKVSARDEKAPEKEKKELRGPETKTCVTEFATPKETLEGNRQTRSLNRGKNSHPS